MRSSQIESLTLCGSFGFGNAGDEAVPLAFRDLLDDIGLEHVRVDSLTRFDEPALSGIVGLGGAHCEMREALRGNPLLMVGGGIVEANNFCVLARCHSFLEPGFTAASGMFAVNVESAVHYSFLQRRRIGRWLKNCRLLTVRDVVSQDALYRILGGKTPIEVIGDSVLGMKPAAAADAPEEINGLEPFMTVTLAPRWAQDEAWLQWLTDELGDAVKKMKLNLVFVPMTGRHDDDRPVHTRIARRLKESGVGGECICLDETCSPRVLAAVFKRAKLAVSMRLHGCVMAFAAGTPFVGLGYHPKIWGFAHTVGWENAVVPVVMPKVRQRGPRYGFPFSVLDVGNGDLSRAMEKACAHCDFSRRNALIECQKQTLADFLV